MAELYVFAASGRTRKLVEKVFGINAGDKVSVIDASDAGAEAQFRVHCVGGHKPYIVARTWVDTLPVWMGGNSDQCGITLFRDVERKRSSLVGYNANSGGTPGSSMIDLYYDLINELIEDGRFTHVGVDDQQNLINAATRLLMEHAAVKELPAMLGRQKFLLEKEPKTAAEQTELETIENDVGDYMTAMIRPGKEIKDKERLLSVLTKSE